MSKISSPNYASYKRPFENDYYTVQGPLFYGDEKGEKIFYGRMHPKMLYIIFKVLKKEGQDLLYELLSRLNNQSVNCKELFGYSNYRYIISYESQIQLGKLLGLTQQQVSKGITQLVKAGLVKSKKGILIINPLVYTTHSMYDVRILDEFNLRFETEEEKKNKKSKAKTKYEDVNENVTRKKQDESKIRKDLEF